MLGQRSPGRVVDAHGDEAEGAGVMIPRRFPIEQRAFATMPRGSELARGKAIDLTETRHDERRDPHRGRA